MKLVILLELQIIITASTRIYCSNVEKTPLLPYIHNKKLRKEKQQYNFEGDLNR